MKTVADNLFPVVNYDHGREYWRALRILCSRGRCLSGTCSLRNRCGGGWRFHLRRTFVIIPLIIYRWGKGAYCGWVCSCGGLAENDGRYAPGKDAAWTILEPPEYDRPGDFVCGVADRSVPIRKLDGAELRAWAHERAIVFLECSVSGRRWALS